MRQLSLEKKANWQDTLAARREQRLNQRTTKMEREEKERRRLDVVWSQEATERRHKIVQEAKKLMFYEKEPVKKVHSEILMDLVLQVCQATIFHLLV